MTEWREVNGWPYLVSDEGRVCRATDASGTRAGRMLKGRVFKNGYRYVCLSDRHRRRHAQVHVLVAEAFLGRRPRQVVNHKNGKKLECNVANLELTTFAGNSAHAVRMGLVQQGERHYAALITADDVRAIRSAVAAGEPRKVVRARYGLSKSGLFHLLPGGKNWRTVE